MSRLKRLIVEAHQRSLWQASVVYLGASFAVLEAVTLFRDEFGLPDWLLPVALVLLLIGVPVVVVTSLAKDEVYGDEVPEEHAEAAAKEDRRLRFLTWRTAGLAFIGAVAMWGVVLTGWVVLGGTGYLLFRGAAAGIVEAEDCVVVAEFEDETERQAAGIAVRELVVTDIRESGYVRVLGNSRVRETLGLMRLPDTTLVNQALALEIARRDNCPVVVSGTVAPLGTGHILSVRLTEVGTGEEVARLGERVVDDSGVLPAAEQLSRQMRRHLGESLPSIGRSEPLERVTTGSFEALQLYSLGRQRFSQGDVEGAIPLLEEAVALDTAFASAYRALSAFYGNLGDGDAGRRNADLAYRFRERLTFRERYGVAGNYHTAQDRPDSAEYYYRLVLDQYPDDPAASNLWFNYLRMGRYEEALQFAVERGGAARVTIAADILGQRALADSGLARYRERARVPPDHPWILGTAARHAYYAGDFLLADSLARMASGYSGPLLLRAALAAMHGRVNQAVGLADSAAVASVLGLPIWHGPLWHSALFSQVVLFATGTPERGLPYLEGLRSQLTRGASPIVEYDRLGILASGYASAGDIRSAQGLLAVMDSLAEANDFRLSGIRDQALALIALQERRTEDAVDHLNRAQLANYGWHRWYVRPLLADALAALGRLEEAIAQHDTITRTYRLNPVADRYFYAPLKPLAHERLGTLYLDVGDTVSAVRHLGEFIELWKGADPELQPRVNSARELLAQVAADETGGR